MTYPYDLKQCFLDRCYRSLETSHLLLDALNEVAKKTPDLAQDVADTMELVMESMNKEKREIERIKKL